jgi:hypothetical protein
MKTPFGYVYGLLDPDSGALRYIGQTTGPIGFRLGGHLMAASAGKHRVSKWIATVVRQGKMPVIRVLAEARDIVELGALEREHIARARIEGHELLNVYGGTRGRPPWARKMRCVATGEEGEAFREILKILRRVATGRTYANPHTRKGVQAVLRDYHVAMGGRK